MSKFRRLLIKLFLVALCLLAAAMVYLDVRIISTFNDRMWELPAKVYARPLELYAGAPLSKEELGYELELLGYRQATGGVDQPGEIRQTETGFVVYSRGFQFPDEQEEPRLIQIDLGEGIIQRLQGPQGNIELMRLEPVQIGGIYPSHGEDRILLRLEDVPDSLRLGLLAVEDQGFYDHWGFSVKGILRAAFSNLRSGTVVAGGSSITQQLVKNYYLTSERTYTRKLIELLMAVLLELHYDKDQILESYMNEVYMGQDGPRAIHGLALASGYFFAKPLNQLDLNQQALLIGMINAPSLYNPLRNPQNAKQRRDLVLRVMQQEKVISEQEASRAMAAPLELNNQRQPGNSFPGYLDLVRRQLRQEYREEDLNSLGLSIFTNFDPILQRQLELSTSTVMDRLDSEDTLQSASIVTRIDTGEVVAIVGGRNARYAGFNRALDARRPAGSLLKPAVYLAALEQPEKYTLATPLLDEPLKVELPNGDTWEPQNFGRESHGQILLHRALAMSYNQASAHLGLDLGIDRVVDMLYRLGVEGSIPEVPALSLGAGEYSPMDMTAMYQSIATGGFRTPLRSIRDIVDAQGNSLRRYPLEYDRSVNLQAMHLLHYALQEAVREGTGKGIYNYLEEDFAVAGKTGTTNNGRDSWFAGFSGDLLTVSWIGRDDNGSTGLTGGTGALHVWAHFMSRSSKRPLDYRMPDTVEHVWIDDTNGFRTSRGCPNSRLMPFIAGSEPTQSTGCTQGLNRIQNWFHGLFN